MEKYRGKHVHTISDNTHLDGTWVYGYLADKNYINSKELEGELLVDELTIGRGTGKEDISGQEIYQGDIIESHLGDKVFADNMVINYGIYQAYCPADQCYMDNVGFFVSGENLPDMPLGQTKEYAKVIGNVTDNPELVPWLHKSK